MSISWPCETVCKNCIEFRLASFVELDSISLHVGWKHELTSISSCSTRGYGFQHANNRCCPYVRVIRSFIKQSTQRQMACLHALQIMPFTTAKNPGRRENIYLCTWFIHAMCFGKRYQNVTDHKTHLVYIMFSCDEEEWLNSYESLF